MITQSIYIRTTTAVPNGFVVCVPIMDGPTIQIGRRESKFRPVATRLRFIENEYHQEYKDWSGHCNGHFNDSTAPNGNAHSGSPQRGSSFYSGFLRQVRSSRRNRTIIIINISLLRDSFGIPSLPFNHERIHCAVASKVLYVAATAAAHPQGRRKFVRHNGEAAVDCGFGRGTHALVRFGVKKQTSTTAAILCDDDDYQQ